MYSSVYSDYNDYNSEVLNTLSSTLETLESPTFSSCQTPVPENVPSIKLTSIPLTIALKIFTSRLEKVYRNIHVNSENKDVKLPDFIKKAISACDMYQALFQDDINNSQGVIGLVANLVEGFEVFDYEWENELSETKQKGTDKNIVFKAPLRKGKNKKRQIKWQMQGPLPIGKTKEAKGKEKEQLIEKPSLEKIRKEQIVSKDEKDFSLNDIYTEIFKPSISWADDVEEKFKINELRDDDQNESRSMINEREKHQDEVDLNDSKTERIQGEPVRDHQDNTTVTKFSPYLLKEHAKLIYEELVKEFDTRNKLYEVDKVPHISEKPTGRMKKIGQKKHRHELKLKRHEHSLHVGGLMNRKRNVNKMHVVKNNWEIVLIGIENATYLR
ncbi:hypothetical protein C1645_825127 [Glomus cerebriforme]|uniref:Uncharacterized protein n=1 Tax=Glomus cerebriforme TaxID=658196 RepID=A0A397SW78_9GLOM|nr:hypothetical protein C1645_825127 [Glomus cerebriforme]